MTSRPDRSKMMMLTEAGSGNPNLMIGAPAEGFGAIGSSSTPGGIGSELSSMPRGFQESVTSCREGVVVSGFVISRRTLYWK